MGAWQSQDNYSRQLATQLSLELTDVSCIGATIADIFSDASERSSQISAIKPDVGLITITIGGNDLNYLGGLMASACRIHAEAGAMHKTIPCLAVPNVPNERKYQYVETQMNRVASAITQRAPNAVLVFVDYQTVIPGSEGCESAPMTEEASHIAEIIRLNLETITAQVAAKHGALLLQASKISENHHVCAESPFIRDYRDGDWDMETLPYHPTIEGMTAIADHLEELLVGKL